MDLYRFKFTCTACDHVGSHIAVSLNQELVCPTCDTVVASLQVEDIAGFVYILSNSRMLDLFKVGFSERDPLDRMREIDRGTGVPEPFTLEASFPSKSPASDEALIHRALDATRVNPNREFFQACFEEVFIACKEATGFEPVYLNPNVHSGSGIRLYDPWAKSRSPLESPTERKVAAMFKGQSYTCLSCGHLMRPVSNRVRKLGAIRECRGCRVFVDKEGFRIS